jgi:hypothetical protein
MQQSLGNVSCNKATLAEVEELLKVLFNNTGDAVDSQHKEIIRLMNEIRNQQIRMVALHKEFSPDTATKDSNISTDRGSLLVTKEKYSEIIKALQGILTNQARR